jgi:glycosyltransferase involved in cell wall biosynthesis
VRVPTTAASTASSLGSEGLPLVTIGIPTYNRPAGLVRAARSALAQDYDRVEVLISDNASPDTEVSSVGNRLAAGDSRVRYVCQPSNRGHAANFQWLLESARGEFFRWLADDDWIDPAYVTRCVATLLEDRTVILACGLGRYYREGTHVLDERPITLTSGRPGIRLVRYFARVSLNGPMFGIAARKDFLTVGFAPVVAGDWILIAALAARGRIRTLGDVFIHRSLSGLGSDASRLAHSFGMRGIAARQPHTVVSVLIWRRIALGAPPFRSLNPIARLCVATAAAWLILVRFTLPAIAREWLGADRTAPLEHRVSAWLRARDARKN